MEGWKVWCIRLGSILLALALGALVMGLVGANPFTAYGAIVSGALGKKTAIRQTVKIAVPLLGCALAIAPCFKMRFWNIGAEGQITAGAIAASYFALFWADKLPSPALLAVMGLAGALAGGVWALIPAFFKANMTSAPSARASRMDPSRMHQTFQPSMPSRLVRRSSGVFVS